jgi:hypothetical protein
MNTAPIFQANRESTLRMKQVIQGFTAQQLTSLLPNGWTVSVTLAHLAFWDQRVIYSIELAKKDGKVTPSNFDDSLNDILEPFLRAIPPEKAADMAVEISAQLDQMLENTSAELIEQLEKVNHRWVDRSLHRNAHLDDIESFHKKLVD